MLASVLLARTGAFSCIKDCFHHRARLFSEVRVYRHKILNRLQIGERAVYKCLDPRGQKVVTVPTCIIAKFLCDALADQWLKAV